MSKNEVPLTVLMAVYNGSPFLRTAIESILRQTYSSFHFLIVDDASTDDTREIVRSYDDPRIQLHCLERNVGQTAALNVGLRKASTPWIARMDADDFSSHTRFEEQLIALAADPDLACVGGYAWFFSEDPNVVEGSVTTNLEYEQIKRDLLSGSPLVHGTIIVSREALLEVGGYDDRYRFSADMEMYDRLLPKYRAATIPSYLLGVRRHSKQGSRTNVAFNENIEIFSRRLQSGNYSSEESSIIRVSLSRAYLSRSRRWVAMGRIDRASKDVFSAISASPSSFPVNAFKSFVLELIPEKGRHRLKKALVSLRH